MAADLSPADRAKKAAAERAVAFVEDGMKLGLGTGSTAAFMVRALADRARREALRLTCVPTSKRTADLAASLGLPVVSLDAARWLDLTIDGTDEVDADLTLIKGGGGAHLIEKIVATASDRMVVIADAAKRVEVLGAFPLPVEVIRFGWRTTQALVEEALAGFDVDGRTATLRMNGAEPFLTDEGNHVIDLHLGRIADPRRLALVLNQVPGVVENGLFVDIADVLVIGHEDGSAEVIEAPGAGAGG